MSAVVAAAAQAAGPGSRGSSPPCGNAAFPGTTSSPAALVPSSSLPSPSLWACSALPCSPWPPSPDRHSAASWWTGWASARAARAAIRDPGHRLRPDHRRRGLGGVPALRRRRPRVGVRCCCARRFLPLAAAGFLMSFQQAMNGTATVHYGTPIAATLVNFVAGTCVLWVAWGIKVAVAGPGNPLPGEWWYYLGGPMGCVFIGLGAAAGPQPGGAGDRPGHDRRPAAGFPRSSTCGPRAGHRGGAAHRPGYRPDPRPRSSWPPALAPGTPSGGERLPGR